MLYLEGARMNSLGWIDWVCVALVAAVVGGAMWILWRDRFEDESYSD
jgi:hypothetical protein